jgi:hypothetical protein
MYAPQGFHRRWPTRPCGFANSCRLRHPYAHPLVEGMLGNEPTVAALTTAGGIPLMAF